MNDTELHSAALALLKRYGIVTANLLQRELKVGYTRARATVERLKREGKVK